MTSPYPDNVRAMATFGHVNLVAHDWRALAAFYEHVFGCEPVGAERDISGDWVERTTGVRGARITGRHYRLPGHGPDGPTLEIFSYAQPSAQSHPTADRLGFAHIAFRVDDVPGTLARLLEALALLLVLAAAAVGARQVRAAVRRRRSLDRRSELERAVDFVRDALSRPPPDRRRALGLLARVLSRRDVPLSAAADELAWSKPEPVPERMAELAERVESP
jgi:catechol 2,3-dioxygenase-like lactoylglutathione lyase family enzyme